MSISHKQYFASPPRLSSLLPMPHTLRRLRGGVIQLADGPDAVRGAGDVGPKAICRIVAPHRHGRAVFVVAAVGTRRCPVLELGRLS